MSVNKFGKLVMMTISSWFLEDLRKTKFTIQLEELSNTIIDMSIIVIIITYEDLRFIERQTGDLFFLVFKVIHFQESIYAIGKLHLCM